MADAFPWQQGMFKMYKEDSVVLVLSCPRNFLNMIFTIKPFFNNFQTAFHQLGKLFGNRSSRE